MLVRMCTVWLECVFNGSLIWLLLSFSQPLLHANPSFIITYVHTQTHLTHPLTYTVCTHTQTHTHTSYSPTHTHTRTHTHTHTHTHTTSPKMPLDVRKKVVHIYLHAFLFGSGGACFASSYLCEMQRA